MKNNIAWAKAEICKLFDVVAEYKKKSKPLIHAFTEFGVKFGRKTNSVRNFYYTQLKIFENTPELSNKWGIDLSEHQKSEQKFFTEQELELSMDKISSFMKKGYSVRKACYEVACGDLHQMLRLQNKYHSQKQKTLPQKADNVLVMPSRKQTLSDSEINSLFMGLVKLVKRSAEESLGSDLLSQVQSANAELRKSIKNLSEKEREVKLLRKKFELLSNEKYKLKEELKNLRSQNVELLKTEPRPAKLDGLKTYIRKLGKQSATK